MTAQRISIGVSKLSSNYAIWLGKLHNDVEIIDFYVLDIADAVKIASGVSGILLTGGCDIHPGMYGRDEDIAYCRDIDAKRDELEMKLIALAFERNIPLLGICRGQQILNVAMKGTLYTDIPLYASKTIVHANSEDVVHPVTISKDSRIFEITGVTDGIVNSSHHQAVNGLAKGLRATAFSPDGLIEAVESDVSMNHRFCMAVQWHPERMDFNNPLSGLLGKAFIKAISEK